MTLFQARSINEARSLLPTHDTPVVILPVYNSYDDVVQCYEAFFRNTPTTVPLLVVDDGGWDRRTVEVLKEVFAKADVEHDVVVLVQAQNKGFVLTMNDGFAAAGRHDVVILNSDAMVGPHWLEQLTEAAYSSPNVGTASALTNYGTIVSVGSDKVSSDTMPGGLSVDEGARRVAAGSARLRPRIPTAVGHCTYVKRSVFDAVGFFDVAFSPGYGEEVDLSQRAQAAGFVHVAADDVFVFHRGGGSFGRSPEIERRRYEHEQLIAKRYPYYLFWVRRAFNDEFSPLAASLLAARRSLLGMRVAIDGRCLGPLQAGTQIQTIETMLALARRDDVSEVILHAPSVVHPYVQRAVAGNAKIRLVPKDGSVRMPARADVVYRGYQIREPDELEWLRSIAERVTVNWLDLIAYHDAVYFSDDHAWQQYRDLAKLAAATVDGLSFVSDHSRSEARAEGLLDGGVPTKIVYNGVDNEPTNQAPPVAPGGAEGLRPGFLFCPGVSYLHKNRVLALKILTELHQLGWDGGLVLAGATPPHGSSLPIEAEYLLEHPELAGSVVTIGAFSESEKNWLYANCGLVLYPTLSEGFGLIPFEAAQYGRACLSSRMGALDEVLGPDVPAMASMDPATVARQALALLTDDTASSDLIKQILGRAEAFTWDGAAAAVMELAYEVTARPLAKPVAVHGEHGVVGLESFMSSARRATRSAGAFDAAVNWAIAHPQLRQRIVPPDSARQAWVRQSIERIRRVL